MEGLGDVLEVLEVAEVELELRVDAIRIELLKEGRLCRNLLLKSERKRDQPPLRKQSERTKARKRKEGMGKNEEGES